MATIAEALQQALRLHQAGRWSKAEKLYRQILQVAPQHADAWQLLGLLAHQTGQSQTAIEYIGRAIALRPCQPAMHLNLGAAYRACGRLPEAQACYREALRLQPNYAEAHNNLGNCL